MRGDISVLATRPRCRASAIMDWMDSLVLIGHSHVWRSVPREPRSSVSASWNRKDVDNWQMKDTKS